MRWRNTKQTWALALLVLAVPLSSFALYRCYNKDPEELIMPTLTASWKDADGITWGVSTPSESDDTPEIHAARHSAAVAALVALHPPVA